MAVPRQASWTVRTPGGQSESHRIFGAIWDVFAAERERWVLWLPVGIGLGIALYFSLNREPPLWIGAAWFLAATGAGLLARALPDRGQTGVIILTIAIGAVGTGFVAAQIRTALVSAPIIEARMGPLAVEGRVVRVEAMPKVLRVTFDSLTVDTLSPERTPRRARFTLRGEQPNLVPGQRVSLRAVLLPAPPPSSPGAYDFQFRAFFDGLGAVGYGVGRATVTAQAERPLAFFDLGVEKLRFAIGERVRANADEPAASVMVALMNGERSGIPKPVIADIRDSGLAHLLAISGLHIGLVAGFVFFAVRGGLALIPAIALRYPIKKWAAVAALIAAGIYVQLAGATVPSQRAFLMIGCVLLAVLFDRRGFSMRLVAWAATVILLFKPDSLLGASFQLSFAAVVALVAVYEWMRDRTRARRREPPTWSRRAALYLGGVALTTIVASLATAPFAIYHFNRFADYGLVANLVAVPLTALWIMPWGVVAMVLMPFGLEGLALVPMSWGVSAVIWVAAEVASWPGAVALLPPMSTWGLAVLAFGGLWLCLWRRGWRLFGGVAIAAGLATMLIAEPPDILVDSRGKLVAVSGDDGRLAVSTNRASKFSRDAWLRRYSQRDKAERWPKEGTAAGGRLRCGEDGCLYRANGHVVALAQRSEDLAMACRVADVVVSTEPVRETCPSAHTIVDRFDLWRNGAYALWLGEDGVRVESSNGRRGDRPWVVHPERAFRVAAGK